MKNILLLVHDDAGQEARVQVALDLTRALDGHLTCIDVSVPVAAVGEYNAAVAEVMLIEVEHKREADNRARLEGRLAGEGIAWTWRDTTDTLADGVVDAAALADLIVLNRRLDSASHPDMRDVTSRVLMQARKPVLAVPDSQRGLQLDRVLVAWDGQGAVAETLRAAVPLLKLAREVAILTVDDGSVRTPPTEAAEYLSRHGIHPEIRIVEDRKTQPDAVIAAEAERFAADYVVMGAYSHGRLVEVLGGVTKRLLGASKLPLLLGR
jgi:nucleotide-binding universal stress UspA family protein